MSPYLLALDQGTSSSRALLFDTASAAGSAVLLASAARQLNCVYPQPGWVEQDAGQLWQTQLDSVHELLAQNAVKPDDIAALGITNQRETVIAWQRDTGEPLCPAIVWQCRRTAAFCEELKRAGNESWIRERSGLLIDAYFSASKMRWILEHVPAAKTLATRHQLCFGTVDSWLIWKLSAGRVHVTDASNAARTQLFNIRTGDWDDDLLQLFGIPPSSLPRVCASSGVIAHTDASLFGAEIPIAGVAGDQQAALFGQACYAPGMAKNTYGTGCFLLMNTGREIVRSQHGLLSTVAWKIGNKTTYALEGSVFMAGALIQWLRDQLGIVSSSAETETLARSVPDNGGVYIVPAFTGLGAPHWNMAARGLICGLTRGSSKAHIARAALEAVAYQTHDVLRAMAADAGQPLRELRIDGGMVVNELLCQFQANVLRCGITRPRVIESTALGAALLAGLGVGVWASLSEIETQWEVGKRFEPKCSGEEVADMLFGWQAALNRALS